MRNTLFIFVFLICAAMTCTNRSLVFAQHTDIQVTPNPIPVVRGLASFELKTTLPAGGPYKKIDSIVLELSCELVDADTIIGTSILHIPQQLSVRTALNNSKAFELIGFTIPVKNELYFHMVFWRNGKSRSTDKLAIARFVSGEGER